MEAEADFSDIPADLYQRASAAIAPPVVPQLLQLDFTLIPWTAFEQLTLEVAEDIDSLRGARLYGRRGQNQSAIDFYGMVGEQTYCYQARDLTGDPTPALLRSAVADFKNRGRKFAASRFVLCIARSGRSTQVQDALRDLKAETRPLEIELYDADILSRLLRGRRDIVFRYFGSAWSDAFCGPMPTPPAVTALPQDRVDALLRGPLAALGLADRLSAAEGSQDPAISGPIYHELAERLHPGYSALSTQMRLREAESALQRGDATVACAVWLEVARDAIDTSPILLEAALARLHDNRGVLSASDAAFLAGIEAKARWFRGDADGVGRLADTLDALDSNNSENALHVAMWLGETAVIDRAFTIVQSRASTMARLAHWSVRDHEDLSVRVSLSINEVLHEWTPLVSLASTGRLSAANCGLVLARYGRWLAQFGRPDDSVDAYLQAVGWLARANYLGDAAEALYAIVSVLLEFGPTTEARKYQDRAHIVRGERKRFVADRDYEAAAMVNLHTESFAEAHLMLRRWLWQSTVYAHTADEYRARTLLGDLYKRAGEGREALHNYLRAGAVDHVERLLADVIDFVPVGLLEGSTRPKETDAYLAALEQESDLVPVQVARAIFPRLMELRHGLRQGFWVPTVAERSLRLAGWLALQLTDDQLLDLIAIFVPLIPRPLNTVRRFDDAIVNALKVAWGRDGALRDRVTPVVADLLCETNIGQEALDVFPELVSHDDLIAGGIRRRAHEGCGEAVLVLALAGIADATVSAEAIGRYRAVMALTPRRDATQPMTLGANYEIISAFAPWLGARRSGRLARHLMTFARSEREPEVNRASAIAAVGLLATHLSRGLSSDLFPTVVELAGSDAIPSDFEALAKQSRHLLSQFRLLVPQRDLPRASLLAAARLCFSPKMAQTLKPLIAQALASADSGEIETGLAAYVCMRDNVRPSIDLVPWAGHPSYRIRALAVRAWALNPERNPGLGEKMASDPHPSVRRTVALALRRLDKDRLHGWEAITETLSTDASAAVREFAREARRA